MPLGFQFLMRLRIWLDGCLSKNTSFFRSWLTWEVIKRVNSLCAFCECDRCIYIYATLVTFVTFTPLESDLSWEVSKVQNCDRLFRHCHLHRKCHLQTFYPPSSEEVPSTLEVPWRCLLPPWYENNPSLDRKVESNPTPIVRSHSDEKIENEI